MIDNRFNFQLKNEVFSGFGLCRELDVIFKALGKSRVIVLVDQAVMASSYYEIVAKSISDHIHTVIPISCTEEPAYDYLDEIAEEVRRISDFDLIVGIGGGSCLDITKAVAVLKTNPGKAIGYRGFDMAENEGVPTLCIPTTAGTGSEATINAVFTDTSEMKKLGINGRYINATYSVLDAEWSLSCPQSVAVSSGMDAVVHALESYMCRQATPLSRMHSREAFRLLFHNLPSVINDPLNSAARQSIQVGAYLAAVGLFNSGSGIAGAFSYPLGVHYKVPHGIGGGMFISAIVKDNVDRGYTGFSDLLDTITPVMSSVSREDKAIRFAESLQELADGLGVPKNLVGWGINDDHFDKICELMLPMQGAFDQNPVPFSASSDAPRILKSFVCAA